MRLSRTLLLGRLLCVGIVLTPQLAAAHAVLLESEPAAGATVTPGHIAFQLRYNSKIDFKRSRLTLVLPDRSTATLPIQSPAANIAGSQSDLKAPGTYKLRWQVLAVDGHITRGIIPFTVAGQ